MDDWRSREYCIMINVSTGKKYFGQTTQPLDVYLGSGTYWKNHCKSHGGYNGDNVRVVWHENAKTKEDALRIISEFESVNGKYWLSEDWANLVPENADDNPFYGPHLNKKRVLMGTHPFSKNNKTEYIEKKQAETRFGSERFRQNMIEKYGVDNAMKVPEIAEKSGKKQRITKNKNGTAKGKNNSNARGITVNGIHFDLVKDACLHFGISLPTLKKYTDGKTNAVIDMKMIEKNRKKTKGMLIARGYE